MGEHEHAAAMDEVMEATGLTDVGAAFMLGRSGGDAAAAIAEWWSVEDEDPADA